MPGREVKVVVTGLVAVFGLGCLPADAQQYGRTNDPNLGHFYMARQQIQILDDAPAVNDLRTQPAPPGQQQNGALPARPVPLPRAGWQPYSQSIPSLQTSLPKTFNGVPQKMPPPGVNPNMAKAGAYKPGSAKGTPKPGTGAPTGPAVAKTYAPYQGYGGNAPAPKTAVSAGTNGAATHVQGSLLHWSRTR